MTPQQLSARAYEDFASFQKPEHSTNHLCCPECAEYDELLANVEAKELTIEQIGSVFWGPVPSLTPEAMGYFMPRLIELAASGAINRDRDGPYYNQFINNVSAGPVGQQFALFSVSQRLAVFSALTFIKENYYEGVLEHCWENNLESAIAHWAV